jgi:hypothetical protein
MKAEERLNECPDKIYAAISEGILEVKSVLKQAVNHKAATN